MEDGTGFIHSITLNTLNPGGSFNVILNPGLVLATYPGLTGIVDPNDLIIDYNDFGAIEAAIETVIDHAVQLQLGGGATYDFTVEAGYSLGNAFVKISFLRAFEPAGPHVFIDFNAPFSYYYNGTTLVSGQSDGGWVVNFRSHIEAEYQAPCGPIKSDYDIVLENDELQNPVPRPFAVKSPRYQETIICAETGVEVSLDCGPPLFVFDDPTFVSCDPGVPLPDPEDDGCPDDTTINEDIAEIKTSAQQTNEQNIPIPNAFHRVRFSDGRHMLVLDGELGAIDDCYQDEGTVPIDSNTQVFHVGFPDGGGGNASLGDVLALRAGGMAMSLGGPDPDSPMPGQDPTGTVPEGAVPKFTFFIYDHLGNSRILYTNSLTYCHTDSVKYVLEHVLDYYPFGRTLREYVHVRERFQTTYHERDEESGLDYRGARFYDGDVGRFLSVDPLASDFAAWSTYSYTFDNPIRFIDPDGRAADDHIYLNREGNEIARVKKDGPDRYFVGVESCDASGSSCTDYIEVNSPETVKGDLKERNPWNGNIVDLNEDDLRALVSGRTGAIEKEVAESAGPYGSMNPAYSLGRTYSKIKEESQEKGAIDFVSEFENGTIYEINGVHYNSHEGLNYLWGASLERLGVPQSVAVYAAKRYHKGAYEKDVKSGKQDGYIRVGPENEPNHNKAIRAGYGLFK
jgi:RHS repeat-associated protein